MTRHAHGVDAPPAGTAATPAPVTVLFFAQLREAAGAAELRVHVTPGTTVAQLAARLERERQGLDLSGAMCAVDEAYAEPGRRLGANDTVAFLPPVSGG